MKPKRYVLLSAFLLYLSALQSSAAVCDYRPSELIGGAATGAIGSTGAAAAAVGVGAKATGFYVLTHSVTGAYMLGSTAAGASAAGTVGIIGGTAGFLGTAGAILMSPVTITIGAIAAAGVGVYEGACYFQDERVTDYHDVLKMMEQLAAVADPKYFRLVDFTRSGDSAIVIMKQGDAMAEYYEVRKLYIVNGVLIYRDWGLNTTIGNISFVAPTEVEPVEVNAAED